MCYPMSRHYTEPFRYDETTVIPERHDLPWTIDTADPVIVIGSFGLIPVMLIRYDDVECVVGFALVIHVL